MRHMDREIITTKYSAADSVKETVATCTQLQEKVVNVTREVNTSTKGMVEI